MEQSGRNSGNRRSEKQEGKFLFSSSEEQDGKKLISREGREDCMSWHQHHPQHSKWRAPPQQAIPTQFIRPGVRVPSTDSSQGWPVLLCSSIRGAKKHLFLGFKERLGEYLWISLNFILLQVHYMVKESSSFLSNLCPSQQVKWDCRFLASSGTCLLFSSSLPLPPPQTCKAAALHTRVLLQRFGKTAKGHPVPAGCMTPGSAGCPGSLEFTAVVQSASVGMGNVLGSDQGILPLALYIYCCIKVKPLPDPL